MKKQLITGAGITTLALVVGATTMFSPLNPHVAAQQAANDGLHYVSRLSSSELAAMKSTLAADPQALLQAASKAGDLTKISRDEFKALVRESKTTVVRHSDDQGNVSGKIETKPGSSAVDSIGTVDPNTVPQTPGTTGEGTSAGTNTDTPPALTEADVKVIDARIESAVKFVKYTNAEGRTVIVAFDSTSKPVFTATVIR